MELPTYPFDKKPYWLEDSLETPDFPPAAGSSQSPDAGHLLYELAWQPRELAEELREAAAASAGLPEVSPLLVLDEGHPAAAALVASLRRGASGRVLLAQAGEAFAPLGEATCRYDPHSVADYTRLLEEVGGGTILQLLPRGESNEATIAQLAAGSSAGHEPLLALCEAWPARAGGRSGSR